MKALNTPFKAWMLEEGEERDDELLDLISGSDEPFDLIYWKGEYIEATTLDTLTEEQARGKVLTAMPLFDYDHKSWLNVVKYHINQALKEEVPQHRIIIEL